MKVIYAGSFDPVTNGHLDIIERAKSIFGHVIVAVLDNVSKKSLFTTEERLFLLKEVLKDDENIEIDSFSGLLVDYAKKKNCKVIVRGLRSASDYLSEYTLAMANMHYKDGVETVFLLGSNEKLFVSSSLAKEVATFDGDLTLFVPDIVGKAMKDKLLRR
ncbi:phosphopantetheine adenylyltransferase [Peptoniphilus lacrimalis DNF00528]|uniref:Phosphopantetheine adenylyltransferase n=1 Tax=Peptoniphilus lacrimalis 315-B TaxID=596330 RepID=D1VSD1_9FIRM|nr:pantetheine-phosphate adenylyltransferase [Peptoniphilus lacrimalis]EFA90619.1 pantetheine-phosphate adenylyltransferase [Peptoniphilus lacrimalis 315-B]KGF33369.1 phosphopantetheine adenylyltransferase [Peptoniphilus lacrimalis DNF00528]